MLLQRSTIISLRFGKFWTTLTNKIAIAANDQDLAPQPAWRQTGNRKKIPYLFHVILNG
jgi:hypothetical protein